MGVQYLVHTFQAHLIPWLSRQVARGAARARAAGPEWPIIEWAIVTLILATMLCLVVFLVLLPALERELAQLADAPLWWSHPAAAP